MENRIARLQLGFPRLRVGATARIILLLLWRRYGKIFSGGGGLEAQPAANDAAAKGVEKAAIQVSEAQQTQLAARGRDALCSLLRKTAGLSSSEAANSIISSVRQWSAKQDDDLTVLVCDYVGDGPTRNGVAQLKA